MNNENNAQENNMNKKMSPNDATSAEELESMLLDEMIDAELEDLAGDEQRIADEEAEMEDETEE